MNNMLVVGGRFVSYDVIKANKPVLKTLDIQEAKDTFIRVEAESIRQRVNELYWDKALRDKDILKQKETITTIYTKSDTISNHQLQRITQIFNDAAIKYPEVKNIDIDTLIFKYPQIKDVNSKVIYNALLTAASFSKDTPKIQMLINELEFFNKAYINNKKAKESKKDVASYIDYRTLREISRSLEKISNNLHQEKSENKELAVRNLKALSETIKDNLNRVDLSDQIRFYQI